MLYGSWVLKRGGQRMIANLGLPKFGLPKFGLPKF
jgi:hypothetical protein